jgi:23S rRNA (uracil1939-C5)-methyltransferase
VFLFARIGVMKKKILPVVDLTLEKLVHGGQAMGTLEDGRKVFVWNGLPGETVQAQLTKSKKDFAEGFVVEVTKPSKDRITTLERQDIELSVAPWSIMSYSAELQAKADIVKETFSREGLELPELGVQTAGSLSSYRNKVEFSFWGDDDGLHYAHYIRASHQKRKLDYPYNPLIPDQMAAAADAILIELNKLSVRAGDLKSLILRCDASSPANSKVVAALYVKTKEFPKLEHPNVAVVYSNPKSPASIITEVLYANGDITLKDTLLGENIMYDVFSFFQVNLPIFELALRDIEVAVGGKPSVDFYSGVGGIGIAVGASVLVESDGANIAMAKQNAGDATIKVVHAPSEQAVEYIDSDKILIVDPPRAGLHQSVIERILEVSPPKVVYLSCNPSTQARDIRHLSEKYKVSYANSYNFFPRTPHIESLIVLELK